MKSCGGLRPSFSAHVRWCEHGAPVWIRGTRHRIEGQTCGIPAIGAGIEQKRSNRSHQLNACVRFRTQQFQLWTVNPHAY